MDSQCFFQLGPGCKKLSFELQSKKRGLYRGVSFGLLRGIQGVKIIALLAMVSCPVYCRL